MKREKNTETCFMIIHLKIHAQRGTHTHIYTCLRIKITQ